MEIDIEKLDGILKVYQQFSKSIGTDYTSDDQKMVSASLLTAIYFKKDIDYRQFKDSIRDGIEESKPFYMSDDHYKS